MERSSLDKVKLVDKTKVFEPIAEMLANIKFTGYVFVQKCNENDEITRYKP